MTFVFSKKTIMGLKGDKHTPDAQLSADLLLEKLSPIGGITSKKMFGGHGIFHDNKMFGMVDSKGQPFLKTNESVEQDFIKKGSIRHGKMPYHTIPDEILKSTSELIELAKKSIDLSK